MPVKIDSLLEAVYFCAVRCFSLSFFVSIKYNIEYIKMQLATICSEYKICGHNRKNSRPAAKNRAARWPYGKQKKYKENGASF